MNAQRHEFMAAVNPVLDGLFGAAVRLTGSRSDADDLVQEALLNAYQAWHRFIPGTNVRAWLHRILVNAALSEHRAKAKRTSSSPKSSWAVVQYILLEYTRSAQSKPSRGSPSPSLAQAQTPNPGSENLASTAMKALSLETLMSRVVTRGISPRSDGARACSKRPPAN